MSSLLEFTAAWDWKLIVAGLIFFGSIFMMCLVFIFDILSLK